jgi:hypothetical protein
VVGLSGSVPGIWLYPVGFTLPCGVFPLRGFVASIQTAQADALSRFRFRTGRGGAGTTLTVMAQTIRVGRPLAMSVYMAGMKTPAPG